MLLSVSICCGGYLDLGRLVREIDQSCADLIHVDIMDGYFVPEMSAGPGYLDCIRESAETPLDIHFMLERPETLMPAFRIEQGDRVCFHLETAPHAQRFVDELRDKGALVGIAINPGTPLSALDELLPQLDFVTAMTINPGQAGRPMLSYGLDKVRRIKSVILERGLSAQVELDGASDFENLRGIAEAGTDICVLGARNCYAPGIAFLEAMDRISGILSGV